MRRTVSANPDRSRVEAVMHELIALAAATHPHPNPRVAAAIVSPTGSVVARAAHQAAGQPHAEILALREAGDAARGATMVVTLEPCTHHGRTPPCTAAIVAAGITRVVVGVTDPDTRVAGGGLALLEDAGVIVEAGLGAAQVEALDPGYFHHRRTGRPLMTLKSAVTLDGQAAAADGTSQWITSAEARSDAHLMRSRSDAVMVGAGTLRSDDPALTVRLEGFSGRQPRPVIVAGDAPLPESARVWKREPLVYGRADELPIPGGEYVSVPGPHWADVGAIVKDLGSRGFIDVLVEGGPTLARSLLDAQSIDRVVAYIAGRLAGGTGSPMIAGTWATLTASKPLRITDVAALGNDIRVTADVVTGEET